KRSRCRYGVDENDRMSRCMREIQARPCLGYDAERLVGRLRFGNGVDGVGEFSGMGSDYLQDERPRHAGSHPILSETRNLIERLPEVEYTCKGRSAGKLAIVRCPVGKRIAKFFGSQLCLTVVERAHCMRRADQSVCARSDCARHETSDPLGEH